MAACLGLPREPVTVQPWTMSLHLPNVAARLAVVDPEVRPLVDRLGFRLGQGMEVRSVRLPSPVTRSLLEGLRFTRPDGPMCGQRSSASSRARGLRPCGLRAMTDWWRWSGGCGR